MDENSRVTLASAIFCDSAAKGVGGKVDCKGVFTSFLAWSYPTSIRTWYAVLTTYDIPANKIRMSISISTGKGKKTQLAIADVMRDKGNLGSILNIPLQYRFNKEGVYKVHFNIVGTTTSLKVPVKVITQTWPKFTEKQLDFLKDNQNIPHSIRTNIICSDCSSPYVFEESVLPNTVLAAGVQPFPESGVFECGSCKHRLYLKDIQGQVRNSIKTAVAAAMRGEN